MQGSRWNPVRRKVSDLARSTSQTRQVGGLGSVEKDRSREQDYISSGDIDSPDTPGE